MLPGPGAENTNFRNLLAASNFEMQTTWYVTWVQANRIRRIRYIQKFVCILSSDRKYNCIIMSNF